MALTDNIINYWKLDGDSVDVVSANNGVDTTITYSSGNGKINQGAGFNGTTSKIVLSAITMPTDLTISAWCKFADLVNSRCIFGDSNTLETSLWWFLIRNPGKISFQWSSSGLDDRGYQSNDNVITDGNFHHVVVTQVGTGAPIFYLDGSSITVNAWFSDGAATKPTGQGSEIGGSGLDLTRFFNGAIDEMGIWSRAISSAEVTSLYNGGAGLAYPFSSGAPITRLFNLLGVGT